MTENKFKVNIPRAQCVSTHISGFDDHNEEDLENDIENLSCNDLDDLEDVQSDDDNEEDKIKMQKLLDQKKENDKLKKEQQVSTNKLLKESISNRMSIRLSQSVSLSMSQSQYKDELIPENFTDSTVFYLDRINQIYEQKEKAKGKEQKKFLKKLKIKMDNLRIIKNDFTVSRKIATQNLLKFHNNDITSHKNCLYLKLQKQIYKYTLDIDFIKVKDVIRSDKQQFIALEALKNEDLLVSNSDRQLFYYSSGQKDVLTVKQEISCKETVVFIKQFNLEKALIGTKSHIYFLDLQDLTIDYQNPVFVNPLFQESNIIIDHRTQYCMNQNQTKLAISLQNQVYVISLEKKNVLLKINLQNEAKILTFNSYNADTLVVVEKNEIKEIQTQNLNENQQQVPENPENLLQSPVQATVNNNNQNNYSYEKYNKTQDNQNDEEEITSKFTQYYLDSQKLEAVKISETDVYGEILDIQPNTKTKELVLMRLDVNEKGQKITCFDIIRNVKSKVKIIDSIDNNHFVPLQNCKFDSQEELMFALGPDYIRVWKYYIPKEVKQIKDNLRETLF